ncbi:MAG TPA: methyltransferase domain-containing protein, partial [Alphaproteobacteria bacterium]
MRLFKTHDMEATKPDLPGFTRMASDLMDRLRDIKRKDFQNAAWISPIPYPEELPSLINSDGLTVPVQMLTSDIEKFTFDENTMDLIIICGRLDTVNDLPGVLVQIRRALKPDGLFMCALPGGETLHELRDSLSRVELQRRGGVAPRVHPMIDLQTWAGLLQRAGFALPVADSMIVPVS